MGAVPVTSLRARKGRRMKKLQSSIVLVLLILTVFSSFNFTQTASASPPATGDKAFANATASYTHINYWQQQPSTNLKIWANNNSTVSRTGINDTGLNSASVVLSLTSYPVQYSYNGTFLTKGTNGFIIRLGNGNGGTAHTGLGTLYASLSTSAGTSEYSYSMDTVDAGGGSGYYIDIYPTYSLGGPCVASSITFTLTGYGGYSEPISDIWSTTVDVPGIQTTSYGEDTINFDYGWSYNYKSISSSFSISGSPISYEINWTAQQKTNATYNSVTQSGATEGHFTGSLSVTSVTFQADSVNFNQQYYSVSYFLSENITSSAVNTYGAEEYIYGISENGNFFNSTAIYFNYTVPSGASTSYPISYKVTITNVTLTNPNAPVDQLSLNSQNFTAYFLTRYKDSFNISAYKNFSTAQNAYIKFSTWNETE